MRLKVPSTLSVLLVALATPALAKDVKYVGRNGAAGAAGSPAPARNNPAPAQDANNTTSAYGGIGGASETGTGGAGGAASADTASLYAGGSSSVSSASGGTAGAGLNGGTGGSATAKAVTVDTQAAAEASAIAYGGGGGRGQGAGSRGGDGGPVSAIPSQARATGVNKASASVYQQGGSAGLGDSGGAGAPSFLNNAVSGATRGGELNLSQIAQGGNGGSSNGGVPGAAGAAQSNLTLTNTDSAQVRAEVGAQGGAGGSVLGGGTGALGGTASATGNVTATQNLDLVVNAKGGGGGAAQLQNLPANGGNGGDTQITATGKSTDAAANVLAEAIGGTGGAASGAGKLAGVGGAALNGRAEAIGAVQAGVRIAQTGGQGGIGYNGANGGAGGIASNTVATVTASRLPAVASAEVAQTGGSGGVALGGGQAGKGAPSLLENAVSGKIIARGALTLRQTAQGGNGGEGHGGSAGAAGDATSTLTLDNARAYALNAELNAYSGDGGSGYDGALGAVGGKAYAGANLKSGANIILQVNAVGGTGGNTGTIDQADVGNGAKGGQAIALATGTTTSSVHSVQTDVLAQGGDGGWGAGPNAVGGNGNVVTSSQVRATVNQGVATARLIQVGGTGGAGWRGANGGQGAASDANNVVGGTSQGGKVVLKQVSQGGTGGDSSTALAGKGGLGKSTLTLTDTSSLLLQGAVVANGGDGGDSSDGGKGGTGGVGVANVVLTGKSRVHAIAQASGGQGGDAVGGVAGLGQSGSADATATASDPQGVARAQSFATGAEDGTADKPAVPSVNPTGWAVSRATATGATAVAEANATAAPKKYAAATATTYGSAGQAQANATSSGDFIDSLTTSGVAPGNAAAQADAWAAIGTQPKLDSPATTSVYAYGAGRAAFGTLGAKVAANFRAPGLVNFGAGTLGARYVEGTSGEQAYSSTIAWVIDPTAAGLTGGGRLKLGLVGALNSGASFTRLVLTVRQNGTVLLSRVFTTPTAAARFFADNALDLGPWAVGGNNRLQLSVNLLARFRAPGSYGVGLMVGSAAGS